MKAILQALVFAIPNLIKFFKTHGLIGVRFVVKAADGWIGFYWDDRKTRLYTLPIPFIGLCWQWHPLLDQGDLEDRYAEYTEEDWAKYVLVSLWPKTQIGSDEELAITRLIIFLNPEMKEHDYQKP